jgi:clan AA aspartic protease (TIGR02281 family)
MTRRWPQPRRGAREILALLLTLAFAVTAGAAVADLNEAGRAAYARGDYEAAERLFSQAIAQAPDEPLLHYHRGVALMRLSRWQEAYTAFESALRLRPAADVAAAAKAGMSSVAPLIKAPAVKTGRADDVSIPLRRVARVWMASVRLNNSRTVELVVDTGASACVISPELAADLGIEPGPRAESVTMQVVGARTTGPIVKLASVRVGTAEAEDVTAVVHPIGPGIHGLLGNSFLARFTVTLDPQEGVLHLRPR